MTRRDWQLSVLAALDFMVTWYEGEGLPQSEAAVGAGVTDEQWLAFLVEFLAGAYFGAGG